MKIRNGFVSNSSSSSFCIYGVTLSSDEVYKLLNIPEDDQSDFDVSDFFGELNLGVISDEDYYHIGDEWTSIGDDETGSQFKNRIKNTLMKAMPKLEEVEIGTQEGEIYC